jgi:hypothetical protein
VGPVCRNSFTILSVSGFACVQGCQMVCFQTQKKWVNFGGP